MSRPATANELLITAKSAVHQLDPGRNLGKNNPLNDGDLVEFIVEFMELQKTKADSPKSWSVDVATIDPKTFDLSVKNPNGGEEIVHRSPQEIMDEIAALSAETRRLAGIYERKLAAMEALKQSLLHQAFEGELWDERERDSVDGIDLIGGIRHVVSGVNRVTQEKGVLHA